MRKFSESDFRQNVEKDRVTSAVEWTRETDRFQATVPPAIKRVGRWWASKPCAGSVEDTTVTIHYAASRASRKHYAAAHPLVRRWCCCLGLDAASSSEAIIAATAAKLMAGVMAPFTIVMQSQTPLAHAEKLQIDVVDSNMKKRKDIQVTHAVQIDRSDLGR